MEHGLCSVVPGLVLYLFKHPLCLYLDRAFVLLEGKDLQQRSLGHAVNCGFHGFHARFNFRAEPIQHPSSHTKLSQGGEPLRAFDLCK